MKGAVERVLKRCSFIGLGEERIPITEERVADILERMDELASEGLRVLGLAGKYMPHSDADLVKTAKRDVLEIDCCFIGLVGI